MTDTFDEGSENVTQCLRLVLELSCWLIDQLEYLSEMIHEIAFSGLGLDSTSSAYDIVIY